MQNEETDHDWSARFLILNFSFCIVSTQFPFFKQRRARGQRRARVTNRVGERLADVSPLKRALACFNCVGEPEKLPVRDDAVKRRSPPIAGLRADAEE